MTTTPKTAEDVAAMLSDLRDKRGYLLPHHGLMAVASPELLTAYDATYTALTLQDRTLTLYQKEIVWLIILVSTGEAIATHHIDRLRKGGGGDAEIAAAPAFAAWADGADRHAFVARHWGPHLEGFDAVLSYRDGLETLQLRATARRPGLSRSVWRRRISAIGAGIGWPSTSSAPTGGGR